MYRFYLYVLVSVTASFAVMADPVPVDPQILIDTGGDAPMLSGPTGILIDSNGGGIFAFQNDTGSPLSEIDVFMNVLLSPLPAGYTVDGTISSPISPVRQRSTFEVSTFSGTPCAGDSTGSCIELRFILTPGPLVPLDGNFVLDFNDMANYNSDDLEVEDGTYTGGDAPGGGGSWGAGATAMIDPVAAVPEPSYRATAGFMSLALLAAWKYGRRLTAKKS